MMRLILWMYCCKFCRFFYDYIPSKQFPGKGFGSCNNLRLQSSAYYDRDGNKMQFYVANYFGCHLFKSKKPKHLLNLCVRKIYALKTKTMTRPTKQQRYEEAYEAYCAAIDGTRPHLPRPRSVQTKPTVPVPPKPEAQVVAGCLKWLKARRIFCDRHDCGAGDFGNGYAKYGIEGAGDIIGILPNGRHFEIECKAGGGGRLSIAQQKRMRDVRATNSVYLVVHGVEELAEIMKGLI